MFVFYDWKHKLFSLAPVFDAMQFMTFVNQINKNKNKQLTMQDLNLKIEQIENQLKKNNNGTLPEIKEN